MVLMSRGKRSFDRLSSSDIARTDIAAYVVDEDSVKVVKDRFFGTHGEITHESFNNLVFAYQKQYMGLEK